MSIKYYVRLTGAYLTRFRGTMFIGILIGIITFFGVSLLTNTLSKRNVERIGFVGRYHANELPFGILNLIGDGLTKMNDAYMVEPDLASSWETPDKGKTWIFRLRKDALWQDSTSLTSDTISYEFSKVTIERPDAETITFKLENPFSPFPSVVSTPVFRKGLMGTGEWRVDKITVAAGSVQELILVKDNGKKIYKFYPTLERTKLAFKLGEVDKIEDIIDPTPFVDWPTVEVTPTTNLNQVVVLFFNNRDAKLSEKKIRQALIYAIDKDALGVRALGPLPPSSWAFNPQVKPYAYDTDHARELIKELAEEVKRDLEIKIVASPILLATAEKIAKNWEGVGVKTQVTVSPIVPDEFQAYLTIFDMPKDPDQYPLWHSSQIDKKTNLARYKDLQVDKLLEDGRSELDIEERRKIYLDFQRFLLEEAPAAFLYHPTYYTITRK